MTNSPNLGPDALAWIKENCSEANDPLDVVIARLSARIAELVGARAKAMHDCPVCEQPCDCRYPGAEGEDCECKNYHEMEDRAESAEEALADERAVTSEQAAELERLRTFVNLARPANDEPYMAETGYKLRRAFEFIDDPAVTQAEAQDELSDDQRASVVATWIFRHKGAIEREPVWALNNLACDVLRAVDDLKHGRPLDVLGAAAQPSWEVQPCTGAELAEAAQAAIEPRSDEEIHDAIASTEGEDR